MRIYRIVKHTRAEGPGLRSAVWLQGCSIGCPGCFNPSTWSAHGGVEVAPEELANSLLEVEGTEGVTFLGGEPFDQAADVAAVAESVRAAALSVVTFSGHTYEKLMGADRADWLSLLEATDLLIDGPYLEEQHDLSRPWIGSSNQRYRFLTDRYLGLASSLADEPNRLEVRIAPDGTVEANGMLTHQMHQAIDAEALWRRV